MESQNSITKQSLQDTVVISNSTEVLTKITDAMINNNDNVNLTLKDSKGNDVIIKIPSLFSLDSEIKRLDNNIKSLSGLDGSAYIRDENGNYKKILASKSSKSPRRIEGLNLPTEFNRKNNYFFENFITPLLYVSFDLSDKVDLGVGKISVKRLILDIDTSTKQSVFESTLQNRNDLKWDEVLIFLNQQNISYFVDDDIYDIPASILRYEGTFGVVDYLDTTNEQTGNPIRYYRLSNITYTDNLSSYKNNVTLKVGDILELNESTKFKVNTIDTSTRYVSLTRISGNDAIPLGDNILSLESKKYTSKQISINIGFNEKQIIFLRPINTETNVTSTNYSDGVCFDSNELKLYNSSGLNISLKDYYNKEVVDFGAMIMAMAKEKNIPSIFGNIPNSPVLNSNDFKVVQINTHLEQESLVADIKQKITEKTRLKNEIDNIRKEISRINDLLNASERNSANFSKYTNQLKELTTRRKNKTDEYVSIVSNLSLTYKNNPKNTVLPKYRVRGFWAYPESKNNERFGTEDIVQFIVYYRYLSANGKTGDTQKLSYSNTNGNIEEGIFSNWNVIKTNPKKQIYDVTTGKYIFDEDDSTNPDKINTNQLDIPINPGEIVEIKIQSVSVAGYPNNSLVSDFSAPVTIEFPAELNEAIDLYSILEETAREEERGIILRELQDYDLDKHLRNTNEIDNKYFAHIATELNSNLTDSNGDILSVYDVLKSMQNQIDSLRGQLNSQSNIEVKNGKLNVYIEGKDRFGNITKYPVKNNSTVFLEPPSYYSQISKLPSNQRRGAILEETYKLVIENTGSGVLELNSKYPGVVGDLLPEIQSSNLIWKGSSFFDDDYKNNKLYYKVPVRYNTYSNYNSLGTLTSIYGFGKQQAKQTPNQFIYSRYKDVLGVKNLYGTPEALHPINLANQTSSGNRRDFIWNGEYYNVLNNNSPINNQTFVPAGSGLVNEFCVHVKNPDIFNSKKTKFEMLATTDVTVENILEHAKYFNIEKGSSNYNLQSEIYTSSSGKFLRMGFLENDRYLVGSNTTGMYLYLNPTNPSQITTGGNDSLSSKKLEPGDSISIPIKLEYRMADYFDEADTYISNKNPNVLQTNSLINNQFIGVVGGYNSSNVNRKDLNIQYEKTLGLDITSKNNGTFSFDINVNCVYGSSKSTIPIEGTLNNDIVINTDRVNLGGNGGSPIVITNPDVLINNSGI